MKRFAFERIDFRMLYWATNSISFLSGRAQSPKPSNPLCQVHVAIIVGSPAEDHGKIESGPFSVPGTIRVINHNR